jgi:single stranded DNA-binding protein
MGMPILRHQTGNIRDVGYRTDPRLPKAGWSNNPIGGKKMSNSITIAGNIGQQPELRITASGMAVVDFTVATTHGKDEKKKTSWFNVVCFGKTAENVAASVNKGDSVIVMGRMEQDEYTKKDGTKGKSTRLVADEVGASMRWDVWVKDRSEQTMKQVGKTFAKQPTLGDEEPF